MGNKVDRSVRAGLAARLRERLPELERAVATRVYAISDPRQGGVHGATTTVLLHAYVDVPAPTAVIVRATVTRIHQGRFGLRLKAHIPEVAGGAGSATAFDIKIGRRYTYRGQRKGFLTAGCPTGSWATKGNLLFSDKTRLGFLHVFSCTGADDKRVFTGLTSPQHQPVPKKIKPVSRVRPRQAWTPRRAIARGLRRS